jgi:hypothetical protein
MENTTENKEKFLAQYWAQKIGFYDKMSAWNVGKGVLRLKMIEYIELKPLSSISDEEIEDWFNTAGQITQHFMSKEDLIKYNGSKYIDVYRNHFIYITNRYINFQTVDWIRHNGFAWSWMGLSVEKQIEYGWIKLIN